MKNIFETSALFIVICLSTSWAPPAGATGTMGTANADTGGQTQQPAVAPEALFKNGDQAISLGAGTRHDNLTIFPLLASNAAAANPYTPLDRAMDAHQLRVREKGSASVPTLRVKNTGKKKVFVMTGEIVTGAKQDRMSAHDVLLPPNQKEVEMSVYCVEQGRWVESSRQFAAGKTAGTTILRKTAARKGSQGKIWSKVAKKSRDASVSSATGTMQAVYNNRKIKKRIAAYEKALGPIGRDKDVVGFVVAVDGNIMSADLFANHALTEALFGKLLKAAAIDAVTSTKPMGTEPTVDAVRQFVKVGFNGNRKETPNPGLGEEFLINAANDIDGAVLVHNSRIVHLSLFGPDREDGPRALERPAHPSRPSQTVSSSRRNALEKPHESNDAAKPNASGKKPSATSRRSAPKRAPQSKRNAPQNQILEVYSK